MDICLTCNEKAVWFLLSASDIWYCDNCVPRGCSCESYNLQEFPEILQEHLDNQINFRVEYINNTGYLVPLDKLNRENPCCEYDFEE